MKVRFASKKHRMRDDSVRPVFDEEGIIGQSRSRGSADTLVNLPKAPWPS